MCGGTRLLASIAWTSVGLSPRVRGNPINPQPAGSFDRSIPACAGEPRSIRSVTLLSTVYPRVCGGTDVWGCGIMRLLGLSPRVRGNPPDSPHDIERFRSIPACAGEPPSIRTACFRLRVYPRVCGGTLPGLNANRLEEGLSPRVRGNPFDTSLDLGYYRSIPACAGEPDLSDCRIQPLPVYPRVCGGTLTSTR